MKLRRRRFLRLAAGAAVLPAVSRIARAENYPSRTVRLIVGFAPGGATDIMGRLMGQWLSERLGRTFIVENRAGAGSNVGTEVVVNAAPDGHTLLVVTVVNAINATLYEKINFNFVRDIAPVGGIHREPLVILVNPSLPATTVPEFIAYAKSNRGKINMASGGVGSANHLSGELFKMMTDVDLVHVPYRGAGPALIDLLAGQMQVLFATMSSSIGYIRDGRLRALAVTTATRSPVLPDIPTVAEFVQGYEASFWSGIGAPKKTPADIIDTLNKEMNAGLADAKMKARFADLGSTALPGSPADFGRLMAEDVEKMGKVVKFCGAKVE
jgi:tripartite-type tricarboxylate transporter receptor subunit TctC